LILSGCTNDGGCFRFHSRNKFDFPQRAAGLSNGRS
jgi:hypothetical protein